MSAAIMTAALTAGSSAMAQTRTLEVIVFAGASALPIYVAQEKGFFAKEGLTVNVTATPSSGFQMSNLINGKFHIAGTAADNLIAYQEGQGTSAVEGPVDLIMVMGGSSTELALMAQPSIKSIGELKGKQFALDSLSTGYAFVLRKMLEKNGLQPSDYEFVAVGGTRERLESLKDGKMSAALVSEPFTTQAKNAGYTFLGEAVSAVGPYLASVQITNRAWAQQNEVAMVGYIRGLVNAVDWLYDASNTDEAVKILAAKVNTSEAVARPSTIGATKGQAALAPKGALDVAGLRTVLEVREQFAQPKKKMGAPEKYYDLTYYNKAVGK
jgi:ABC-type nitrate/sulfonate/bicarbonate transport system substrate-binding protein